jgi:hypothetical protein
VKAKVVKKSTNAKKLTKKVMGSWGHWVMG